MGKELWKDTLIMCLWCLIVAVNDVCNYQRRIVLEDGITVTPLVEKQLLHAYQLPVLLCCIIANCKYIQYCNREMQIRYHKKDQQDTRDIYNIYFA